MTTGCDLGIIGMAVMGQNLVLNIESRGFAVAVYNRTDSRTRAFAEKRAGDREVTPTYSLEEFASALRKPRRVMLMVRAGDPVEACIESLLPHLEEGDIIIDGGNSHFRDTERRLDELKGRGIRYLGVGVSGGEYGALHGPSIMPGGDPDAYSEVEAILTRAAARTEDGPCCVYLGPGGSGHFVKMVHNGIEYAVMELICESYDLMRRGLDISPREMSQIFEEWNAEHGSYLMEITAEILDRVDEETGRPLVEVILDRAGQKGTGKWSVQEALDLGVPLPTIGAAVEARLLSARKSERELIGRTLSPTPGKIREGFLSRLEQALYLGVLIAYAEGMKLLQVASDKYDYDLHMVDIARIWKDGCIIRSSFLDRIQRAYREEGELINLIVAAEFRKEFESRVGSLRRVVEKSARTGIPAPAMCAALNYFDSLSSIELPANLIQAQRDYFGAHTYERRDKEGTFHTLWQDIHDPD